MGEYVTLTFPFKYKQVTIESWLLDGGYKTSYQQTWFRAHGDEMLSTRMLKLFDKYICKSRDIIFKSCLAQGIFPW